MLEEMQHTQGDNNSRYQVNFVPTLFVLGEGGDSNKAKFSGCISVSLWHHLVAGCCKTNMDHM